MKFALISFGNFAFKWVLSLMSICHQHIKSDRGLRSTVSLKGERCIRNAKARDEGMRLQNVFNPIGRQTARQTRIHVRYAVQKSLILLVGGAGFEPATPGL